MKNTLLLFLISIFLFSCASDESKIENRCQELINALKAKDFEAFKQVMITEADARDIVSRMGYEGNRPSEEVIAEKSKEMVRYRKTLFDSYYEDDIPWDKVSIDKVSYKSKKLLDTETAKVSLFYNYDGKTCEMKFPLWTKLSSGAWKTGGKPLNICEN